MLGLQQLGEVISLLMEATYLPDQSDREAVVALPGKRGGGDPRQIEVRDGKASHLLTRMNRELSYMAETYLRELERDK